MKAQAIIFVWCSVVLWSVVDCINIPYNNSSEYDGEFHGIFRKDEVCMKELGCFKITDDFKSIKNRPINVLPHDRATINARFLLYTKQNPKEFHLLTASDSQDLKKSGINPNVPTRFIVHGFMDSQYFGQWMVNMKDEFLMHGESNIIIVDWSGGNKMPYYQASSNTRVVGAEIAELVKALEKNVGIKREDLHIVGHSLGSHVAGYAGERLKTLGRITACDPAEPYFQNMPPSVRLDPTDAQFVDVIHSDALSKIRFVGFGMSQLAGHVDFFPNNGRSQPGCIKDRFISWITDGLKEGMRRFGSCDHQRSVDFMHFSINYRKVPPVGYQCDSWDDFLDGKCTDCGKDAKKCAIMGMRAIEYKPLKDKTQRSFYVQTSAKSPYWLYHYQITVKLFKPKGSVKDPSGTMDVTLFGSKSDVLFHVQKKVIDLTHGSTYKYMVTTDKDLGVIKGVSLIWYHSSFNPLKLIFKPTIQVDYVSVASMNEIEKTPRAMAGRMYCGNPNTTIKPKTTVSLYPDKKCQK